MRFERRHLPFIRITIAIIIGAVVVFSVLKWGRGEKELPEIIIASSSVDDVTFKTSSGDIDFVSGVSVPVNGVRTEARFFGKPIPADINHDGFSDYVLWFSYLNNNSETLYFIAGAINTADGYVGTNAVLLGTDIAPQTLGVQNGIIVANYAQRKEGESVTVSPSVGASRYFRIENGSLIETTEPVRVLSPDDGCLSVGGKFDSENMECLSISKEQCGTIGGDFNTCASACRNDPKAKMCTLQCVGVCQFIKKK